jgi:hypothetical protein
MPPTYVSVDLGTSSEWHPILKQLVGLCDPGEIRDISQFDYGPHQ